MRSASRILLTFFLAALTPSAAQAITLFDYAIYSEEDVEIKENVKVFDGLIGSSQNVSVDSDGEIEGATAGGNFTGGNDLKVEKDIVANGDVTVGQDSNVDGETHAGQMGNIGKNVDLLGDVRTGSDATVGQDSDLGGDLDSGGNIVTDDNVDIIGNATAAGTITMGTGSSAASVNPGGSPQAPDSAPIFSMPSANVYSAGGAGITEGDNASTVLLPGTYGALVLGKNNDLTLTGGDYYFDSIMIDRDAKIFLDPGAFPTGIGVFVTGNMDFGRAMDMKLLSGSPDDIFWELHGDLTADRDGKWIGTFFAPTGSLSFERNSNFQGSLYSRDKIFIGRDSEFAFYVADRFPNDDPNVAPEPSSIYLMGAGLMGVVGLRRRRKT